ncbi:hypothetical protein X808_9100 [Mannheimia varigena USDA-ARS-USMARC-1296]|uniref:Bacteriophage protein n=1 Tax=Mannheimia varigena USDA-ARS-USMARC-1296 TaxID=1433287 RepID=W0QDX8_9PAST|nr:hypothetical protein [Mannheimia varigena]AHG75433.1 hypothetical protein X808_9100 [Mannheimia varigena USDA-ARS-USMARC-1296]
MSAKFKAALEARIKSLKAAKNKVVKIGIVEQQQYEDGTPVAYVAAIHEYGSPSNNIPPRPFFRPTISAQKQAWANIGKQILQNGGSAEEVLDSVGDRAKSDIFETISNIDAPQLAISTKKARNRKAHQQAAKYGKKPNAVSIKPLVDTKLLIHSIGYVVVDKE